MTSVLEAVQIHSFRQTPLVIDSSLLWLTAEVIVNPVHVAPPVLVAVLSQKRPGSFRKASNARGFSPGHF
jgi:hypothetical protein